MDTQRFAQIKAALDAITPGKWIWVGHLLGQYYLGTKNHLEDRVLEVNGNTIEVNQSNGEFIAASPDYVRELVTAIEERDRKIERLRAENEALKALCRELWDAYELEFADDADTLEMRRRISGLGVKE